MTGPDWTRRGRRLAVVAALLGTAASGCGKPVLRIADASLGDYYTEREFRKLSQEQRDEYCAELARQDSLYRSEIAEIAEIVAAVEQRAPRLRAEADSLRAAAEALERESEALRRAPAEAARTAAGPSGADAANRHRVRAGESLWRISARASVYGDGARWPALYEANRGSIADPDLIFPGQELTIPR